MREPYNNRRVGTQQYQYGSGAVWRTPVRPPPTASENPRPLIAGAFLIIVFIMGLVTSAGVLFGLFLDPDTYLEDFSTDSRNSRVEGRITYAGNGSNAPEISITLEPGGLTTITDENGTFNFFHLKNGKYTMMIQKSGYKTIVWVFYITESNQHLKLEAELEPGQGEKHKEEADPFKWSTALIQVCGVLILLFSIMALIGAICAFLRKNFWLALLGAACGIFTIGLVIGFFFSIAALILLLLSRESFR